MKKPYIEVHDNYRIDSGNKLPKLGTVDYAVTTKNGDGFGLCDSGKHFLVTDNISYESVGNSLPQDTKSNQPHQPAKWIHAKNGDIVLQAPNGTLYLEARNIIIDAVGGEFGERSDGNVFVQATNELYLKSSDKVTISGTDVLLQATKTASVVGKCFLNITGGLVNAAATADTGSILSLLDERINELVSALGVI
jgi:hypothetical protein